MIVVTTPDIHGKTIREVRGLARGSTVRSVHVGMDTVAFMRNLVGGEVDEYTKMLAEAREEALDRMIAHAHALGADAIVGMHFVTACVASGAAEIMAYGTAVTLNSEQ